MIVYCTNCRNIINLSEKEASLIGETLSHHPSGYRTGLDKFIKCCSSPWYLIKYGSYYIRARNLTDEERRRLIALAL